MKTEEQIPHTTLGWCKNYDGHYIMCQSKECGKCFIFEPKCAEFMKE